MQSATSIAVNGNWMASQLQNRKSHLRGWSSDLQINTAAHPKLIQNQTDDSFRRL